VTYIEKILTSDEQVLARTRAHFLVLFSRIFKELLILAVLVVGFIAVRRLPEEQAVWFQIALAILAIIVLLSILLDAFKWKSEEYLVTSRRVVHASGILNKRILDSSLSKINDVILEQTWFGRIFDYGTIRILTATEEVINTLNRISKPIAFKHAMLEAKARMEPIGMPSSGPGLTPSQLLEELAHLKERNMITEEEYQEKRKEILKRI
jgi:uncharacterized membrane protein YdbT with pleckstrin-like domain